MAELTGANAYVNFDGDNFHGDFREIKNSEEIELVDATAGADAYETFLKTIKGGTLNMKILYQSGGAPTVAVGDEGTLIFGIEGSASGKPRYSRNAIVQKKEDSVPYKDVIEREIEWKYSGAPTEGTF